MCLNLTPAKQMFPGINLIDAEKALPGKIRRKQICNILTISRKSSNNDIYVADVKMRKKANYF